MLKKLLQRPLIREWLEALPGAAVVLVLMFCLFVILSS